MTDEELISRTHVAVIDALTPLFSPKGIVAVNIVLLVSNGENQALPMHIVLGLNPVAVQVVMGAASMIATGALELKDPERVNVAMPVKN